MKRLVVIAGTVGVLGVSTGFAAAASSTPAGSHASTVPGEQVCLVLSHDPQGRSTDDLCIDV